MTKVFYVITLCLYTTLSFAGAPTGECTTQKKEIRGVITDYTEGWLLLSGEWKYGCTINVRSLSDSLVNQKISNPVDSAEDKYLCDVAKSTHINRDSSVVYVSYCDLTGNNPRAINIRVNAT